MGMIKVVKEPFKDFKRGVRGGFGIEQHKFIWQGLNSQVHETARNLTAIRENRDPWADGAPDMRDFEQVLTHWGINESQLHKVIRGCCIQLLFFGALGLCGLYLIILGQNALVVLQGYFLLAMGFIAVVTRAWRIKVLYDRKFVFFKDWFLFGLFAWMGKETPIAFEKRMTREIPDE